MASEKYTRELTSIERKKIQILAKSMCANYDGYYKQCLILNGGCYMLTKYYLNNFCKYFYKSVLPLDSSLIAGLSTKNTKCCKICGTEFVSNGRQVYCSELCKHIGNRKVTAQRVKKHRTVSK